MEVEWGIITKYQTMHLLLRLRIIIYRLPAMQGNEQTILI